MNSEFEGLSSQLSDASWEQLFQWEEAHSAPLYPKRKLQWVRGEGAYVWDHRGERYLDCTSGHGVAILGHSHPALVEALARQSRELLSCTETFYHPQRGRLLRRLAAVTPPAISRFFLCNSGTESVEAAIKFARLATGRTKLVAARMGFHGKSCGALSLTWKPEYRKPFEPLLPQIAHVPFNDVEALEKTVDESVAAFVVEPIQGESGVYPAGPSYLQEAQRICQSRGALLVLDEVQTGFGRTGSMFACRHYGVEPDLLCLAKGMGGGLPIGAVGLTERVSRSLFPLAHSSTFGGNPIACAAANAVLDVLEGEQLCTRARQMGALLIERLQNLESSEIRQVRGLGLMIGIECRHRVQPFLQALLEKGMLALAAGSGVIRLLPPLIIGKEEIDVITENLKAVLGSGV